MRATPYLASLRIYEPLSAFDPADRLRWQNLDRDETKYGTTVLGKDSLKLSNAAQQRVAVAHGDKYRIPSRSKT